MFNLIYIPFSFLFTFSLSGIFLPLLAVLSQLSICPTLVIYCSFDTSYAYITRLVHINPGVLARRRVGVVLLQWLPCWGEHSAFAKDGTFQFPRRLICWKIHVLFDPYLITSLQMYKLLLFLYVKCIHMKNSHAFSILKYPPVSRQKYYVQDRLIGGSFSWNAFSWNSIRLCLLFQ